MFEEEAKSFGKQVEMSEKFQPMLSWDCGYREGMEIGFQKGATFGYNKANEWHKITDKLPEMGELVYLWTNDKFPIIACRQHGEIDWYWNCNQGDYYINRLASIDASYLWKEIVPPKLTNDKKE